MLESTNQSPLTITVGAVSGLAVGLTVAVAVIAGLIFKVKKMQKVTCAIPGQAKCADSGEAIKTIPERQIEGENGLVNLGVIIEEKQAELFSDSVTVS